MTKEELVEKISEEAMKDGGRMAINSPSTISHELILRTGEALAAYDPQRVVITGVIDTPLKWLEKRKDAIDRKQCHICFSREEMGIRLIINEHDHFEDNIGGRLLLSEEYKKLGINEGKYINGLEMSDLIRMNRTYFESKEVAMQLVSLMRSFKAKVLNDIENSDDKRGNTSQIRRQTVESNLPPAFTVNIPIFKGQPKCSFDVEIDIDPDSLQATFASPDAQDLIAEKRDELMDNVLQQIAELCPEIPIMEV